MLVCSALIVKKKIHFNAYIFFPKIFNVYTYSKFVNAFVPMKSLDMKVFLCAKITPYEIYTLQRLKASGMLNDGMVDILKY